MWCVEPLTIQIGDAGAGDLCVVVVVTGLTKNEAD